MGRIKLQIANKIHLKLDEVGQIINTESPIGFREFIVKRDGSNENFFSGWLHCVQFDTK